MSIIAAATLLATSRQPIQTPVVWLHPEGQILVEGKAFSPRTSEGTKRVKTANGWGYDFDGVRSGLLFGDLPAAQLTQSLTVSTWLYLRSYVNDGPGAQILFRGDDRNGHDPFFLVIHGDGTINFAVQNEHDKGRHITAEFPLNRWVHVVATFNAESGRMRLFLNGDLMAMTITSLTPFAQLQSDYAPGFSIGNVQNNIGPHNQPINGIINDLRLYRGDLDLEEFGMFQSSPQIPPKGSS
ncbi:MAG TPA: LamG domain-containing protein [Fimbriimonadaceae bacterium]|nr:LamG domain-containing protein [Fimbriimonadaceae bacterium]